MEDRGTDRPPGFPRSHSRLATDGAEVQAPSTNLTLLPTASPHPVPRQALGSPGSTVPLVGESDSAGLTEPHRSLATATSSVSDLPQARRAGLRPGLLSYPGPPPPLPGMAILEPGLLTG